MKIKIDSMDVLVKLGSCLLGWGVAERCLVGKSERLVGLVVLAHCISSWYFFVLRSLLAFALNPFRSSLPFGLRTSLVLLLLLPRISPNLLPMYTNTVDILTELVKSAISGLRSLASSLEAGLHNYKALSPLLLLRWIWNLLILFH